MSTSHSFVPPFLHLPRSKTPTWSLSFSFDSSLLLALILHYCSSLTLYLTLFLSCTTHTLPWVFSNSLQTTFRSFSVATVLTIYLPLVAWVCQHLVTRDCCRWQHCFIGNPFSKLKQTCTHSVLLEYLHIIMFQWVESKWHDLGDCLCLGVTQLNLGKVAQYNLVEVWNVLEVRTGSIYRKR